jgi:hypothetical protein
MSAKKAASSTTSKPTMTAGRKSSVNGNAAKNSAATLPPAPSQRSLSSEHIGEVAGEVWGLLAEKDEQTLAVIKKSIDAPTDLVMAALGWLAREGKLAFAVSGRTVKMSLKR